MIYIPIINKDETFNLDSDMTIEELEEKLKNTEYSLRILDMHEPYHHVSAYKDLMVLKNTTKVILRYKNDVKYIDMLCGETDRNHLLTEYRKLCKEHEFTNITKQLKVNADDEYEINEQSFKVGDQEFILNNIGYPMFQDILQKFLRTDIHKDIYHPKYGLYQFVFNNKVLESYDDFVFPKYETINIQMIKREYHVKLTINEVNLYGNNYDIVPQYIHDFMEHDMTIKFKDAEPFMFENVAKYQIYVKTLVGKTLIISIKKDTMLSELKVKVMEKDGIPVDQQRYIYAGIQVDDSKPLYEFNIKRESTVHLVLRLRGGGGEFVNVNQKFEEGSWTTEGPSWRSCSAGLNMEGMCLNRNCDAYNKRTISMCGKTTFSHDMLIECPMCNTKRKCDNIIITNCNLRAVGQKADGTVFTKQLNVDGQPYYPKFSDDIIQYNYLTFYTTYPKPEHKVGDKIMYMPKRCYETNELLYETNYKIKDDRFVKKI